MPFERENYVRPDLACGARLLARRCAVLHNMGGRCNFMTDVNKTAKTIEVRGFCNYSTQWAIRFFKSL
jgi:hypothetical protein